jgi:hypothetical protein
MVTTTRSMRFQRHKLTADMHIVLVKWRAVAAECGTKMLTCASLLTSRTAPRATAVSTQIGVQPGVAGATQPRRNRSTGNASCTGLRPSCTWRLTQCPAVRGLAPRRPDLWRRDVLPRSYDFWRRLRGSKDEFTSPRGPNIHFLQKKDQIIKN